MISVDTNLLVRLLLKDDLAQFRRAFSALETDEEVFIPITVLLELAWVLKSRHATPGEILVSLREILSLPRIRAQHAEAVRVALGWTDAGMDVADALHMALSGRTRKFLTFDMTLARRAAKLGAQPPASAP